MAKAKKDVTPRKKVVTWFLVADGARARILANDGPGKGLYDAADRDFIGAHERMRDLVSDKPGRTQESSPTGIRSAMEPTTDWHRMEKTQFAKYMADILEKAALAKAYDQLVLVAPPQCLGDLRGVMGRHAKDRVIAEFDKDLTHVPIHELAQHFGDKVRV
ncbi:MAG: host attachment protein [Alphaproteobacteria bacterium]